jgi:hypothetical protein
VPEGTLCEILENGYEKRNFASRDKAYSAEILHHALNKPHPESKIFTTEDTEEECGGFSSFTQNCGKAA